MLDVRYPDKDFTVTVTWLVYIQPINCSHFMTGVTATSYYFRDKVIVTEKSACEVGIKLIESPLSSFT